MTRPLSALTLLSLLLSPACAVDDDLEFRATSTPGGGGGGGGPVFNTHEVDQHRFSELRRAEGNLGVALKRVEFDDGQAALAIDFDGGEIVATDAGGKQRSGDALVGSSWYVGNAMWLPQTPTWIESRKVVDGAPHYAFMHSSAGSVTYNCSGSDGLARMLPGFILDESTGDLVPEPDSIFVACRDAAVGKAAAWGYHDLAVALDDLGVFETAIRVVRADYCYDGGAHTVAGVELLVEDPWGVRAPADPDADIEAVWGEDRLICAGKPRHQHDAITCSGVEIPPCGEDVDYLDRPGVQFVTRLPRRPVEAPLDPEPLPLPLEPSI